MNNVCYAPEYVDQLLTQKDLCGLDTLIEIRSRVLPMPKEATLFRGLLYWLGAERSGLYQYYEGRNELDQKLNSFAELLIEFGFNDVADQYLLAAKIWHDTNNPAALDTIEKWTRLNEERLLMQAISILTTAQPFLKHNENGSAIPALTSTPNC